MGLECGINNKSTQHLRCVSVILSTLLVQSISFGHSPRPILNTLCSDLHLSRFPPALLAYLHGADVGEPLYGIMVAFLRNQREQTGFWD